MNLTPTPDRSKLNSASGSFLKSRENSALDHSPALRDLFSGPSTLSFQDVGSALSNRIGRQFDGQLLTEVFALAGKQPQDGVPAEAFVEAYLGLEGKLWLEIQQIQGQMQQTEGRIGETKRIITESEPLERTNSNGIMEGSSLSVSVLEAQNLKPTDSDGSADPYALLHCEGQRIETRYHLNTLNPIWQETFTFQIRTGTDPLKVMVMDHDDVGSDNCVGEVSIDLGNMRDQREHEGWFELTGKEKGKGQGRIRLKMQWIWSKTIYLKEILKEWETVYDDDQRAALNLTSALETLKSPFQTSRETLFPQLFSSFTQRKSSDPLHPLPNPLTWTSFSTILTILFLSTVLISLLSKPDFVNLTLSVLSLSILLIKPQTPGPYRRLIVCIMLAQGYNLAWLGTTGLVRGRQHWALDSKERYVQMMGVFVTLLGDILKLILAAVYCKQAGDLKENVTPAK